MGRYACCECGTDYEVDLDEKKLICPNCGCEYDLDEEELKEFEE